MSQKADSEPVKASVTPAGLEDALKPLQAYLGSAFPLSRKADLYIDIGLPSSLHVEFSSTEIALIDMQ